MEESRFKINNINNSHYKKLLIPAFSTFLIVFLSVGIYGLYKVRQTYQCGVYFPASICKYLFEPKVKLNFNLDDSDSFNLLLINKVKKNDDYKVTAIFKTSIDQEKQYEKLKETLLKQGWEILRSTPNDIWQIQARKDGVLITLFPTENQSILAIEEKYYDISDYGDGYDAGYDRGHEEGYKQGYDTGKNDGYIAGLTEGYKKGYEEGSKAGQDEAYNKGVNEGYTKGVNDGYAKGVTDGYKKGQADGYNAGHNDGYKKGYDEGYQKGYNDGYNAYKSSRCPISPPPTFTGVPSEITRGNTSQKKVIFTFDAGAGVQSMAKILETLSKHNARATFFITGKWAEQNPDLVKQILNNGHEIFNHTYDHPHLTQITDADIRTQLWRTEDIMVNLTGKSTHTFFRPPYGERDDRIRRIAAEEGYRTVMWSVDALDWKESEGVTAQQVKDRIYQNLSPGTIYLMHIGDNITGSVLDEVFTYVEGQGYLICPLTGGL